MILIDHERKTIVKGTPDNLTTLAEGLLIERSRFYRAAPKGAPALIRSRLRAAAQSDNLKIRIGDMNAEIRFSSQDEVDAWLTANPLQEG